MRPLRFVLGSALLAGTLAACGGSSSLPDPQPCASPSPLPTSAATPGITQGNAYFTALQEQFNRLTDLFTRFKLAHPTNTFSRDASFRPSVAQFIDDSTCLARSIQSLQAPTQRNRQNKEQIDAALAAYIDHLAAGRAAVRSRNTTDYHTFWDGLDAKFAPIGDSFRR